MFAAVAGFEVTTVAVRTLTGSGARGPILATPVDVEGYLSDTRSLVRSTSGTEVVSESSFYTDPDKAALFTPDSEVVLPDRTAHVIKTSQPTIGDPDVDHCKVSLT